MDLNDSVKHLIDTTYTPIIITISLALGIIFRAALRTYKTLDTHEKSFTRKRLTRTTEIKATLPKDSALHEYLAQEIELEAFFLCSGIKTSHAKMLFLLEINRDRLWNRAQLKRLSPFVLMKPGHSKPSIIISKADKIGAISSLVCTIASLAVGIFYLAYTYLSPIPYLWLVGFGCFWLTVGAGRLFISDWIGYSIAKNAKKHYLKRVAEEKDASREQHEPKELKDPEV